MVSRIDIGPDGGPYVAINENSNNLELQDINGNVIAKWDETAGQWDLNNNSLTGINAIDAGSANVDELQKAAAVGPVSTPALGGDDAVAIGNNADADELRAVSVGVDSNVLSSDAVAIGNSSQSDFRGVAIGYESVADLNSVAIGRQATTNEDSIAIGRDATVTPDANGVAIGDGAQITAANAVAIGDDATAGRDGIALGRDATAGDFEMIIDLDFDDVLRLDDDGNLEITGELTENASL